MIYLYLLFQAGVSVAYLFAVTVLSAFQTESLRSKLNHPFPIAIQFLVIAVIFIPAGLSVWSGIRLWSGQPLPLNVGKQFLVCVLCALGGYGLLVLREYASSAVHSSKTEREIQTLLAEAKNGSAEKACELVIKGTPKSDEVFGICKASIEKLPPKERWGELKKFTVGENFLTRAAKSDSGTSIEKAVIPIAEQGWFVDEFFTALMEQALEEPANFAQASEELKTVTNFLQSFTQPEAWSQEAKDVFKRNVLPRVKDHYASRLRMLTEATKELPLDRHGVADQSSPLYSSELGIAKNYTIWFAEHLAKFEPR